MTLRPDSLAVAVLLTMLTALGPISTDLYLPSLPSIQAAFGTDVGAVQLTLSVYLVAFGACQLFFGPVSDRFGRRRVMLFGLAVYFLASIACVYAPSIDALIVARFFQAVGGCSGIVLTRAVVRDIHGPRKSAKILSYMGTAMALAPALGPILGGYLTVLFGWQANFWILTGFSGACLLAVALMLQETNTAPDTDALKVRRMARNFATLLGHRSYRGYLLAGTFCYSGLFAFISGSSFVIIEVLGLTADQYGYCFATIVVGYMIGTQVGGRAVARYGLKAMVHPGGAVSAVGGLAMAALAWSAVVSLPAILVPMVIYMIGMGLVLPNAMAGAIGPFPRMAGAASSLMGFTQYGIASLVGLAVGHAFDRSAVPMVSAIAAMGVATYLCYRGIVHAAPAEAEEATA